MRLVSFREESLRSWGILDDAEITDLGTVQSEKIFSLSEVLRHCLVEDFLGLQNKARTVDVNQVSFDLPVTHPEKILCVGANFPTDSVRSKRPDHPTIFSRFTDSLTGTGSEIIVPRNSGKLDFEGELAVIIGQTTRHASVKDAASSIFGYTILNDGSVRDYQAHSSQFTPGKNFPHSGSLGPFIVTADEFGAISSQTLTTRLNGITVQEAPLADMLFSPAEIISYISEWTTLNAGDVIALGTPKRLDSGVDNDVWMFPGDQLEVSIDGIGTLSNRVGEEK